MRLVSYVLCPFAASTFPIVSVGPILGPVFHLVAYETLPSSAFPCRLVGGVMRETASVTVWTFTFVSVQITFSDKTERFAVRLFFGYR